VIINNGLALYCWLSEVKLHENYTSVVRILNVVTYLGRVGKITQVIAITELQLGDIDSVEIIGGSCRIPAVKDVIMDVFKRELSTTLNLDEAVCRGCGLQCAMLSPTFKVRDFSVTDIQPYSIRLTWDQPMEGDNG